MTDNQDGSAREIGLINMELGAIDGGCNYSTLADAKDIPNQVLFAANIIHDRRIELMARKREVVLAWERSQEEWWGKSATIRKTMTKSDQDAWCGESAELNKGRVLRLGLRVQDAEGQTGQVVRIEKCDPKNPADQGAVHIDVGLNINKHWPHSDWGRFLRII